MAAVTYADCQAWACPCAGPDRPADDHQCPGDGLTGEDAVAADEAGRYRPYEPWEGETAVSLR